MDGKISVRIGEVDSGRVVEVPLETALYILPPGSCVDTEDPFKRVLTVQYIGFKEVYVRGLEKGMTRELYKIMMKWMFDRGIEVVRYRHKGKEKRVINHRYSGATG